MLDVLTAVLPLYALIVLGLVASRSAAFRDASGPLNAYVYWFALPAFLFMAVAGAPDGAGLPWTFLAVALVVSMGGLALALRTVPLGTGYAVWVAIGAVGTAVYGMIALGEAATVGRLLCLLAIVAGVVGLKLLH